MQIYQRRSILQAVLLVFLFLTATVTTTVDGYEDGNSQDANRNSQGPDQQQTVAQSHVPQSQSWTVNNTTTVDPPRNNGGSDGYPMLPGSKESEDHTMRTSRMESGGHSPMEFDDNRSGSDPVESGAHTRESHHGRLEDSARNNNEPGIQAQSNRLVESPAPRNISQEGFPNISQDSSEAEPVRQHFKDVTNILTIAVLGRSGSGVSSTIRELVGPNSKCNKEAGNETLQNILEYIVDIPSTDYKLRLLDIPGFVDGRSLEDDSQILASLKSIVQTTGPPDFFLVLSRFDDNRFDGIDSMLVQSLKRVELFLHVFLNNTLASTTDTGSKNLFLLTRMMTTTKATQRRPKNKMEEFKRVIETYTTFPSPISIVVGDNKAETEHGAQVENGYYKLPNKQLYPKNIWEALIDLSSNDTTKSLFTTLMNNRETEMKCEARFISTEWENYDDDADAFLYLLTQKSITVEDTEVNREIQNVFDRQIDDKTKLMEGIVQKIALQLRLQQDNITTRNDLPKNLADRAEFFQKNKQYPAFIPAQLLEQAFRLKMPEYVQALTVGYGYVLMEDEMSPLTPFKTDTYEPSPVGYQLPNFIKCRKYFQPEIKYFKSYSESITEYIEERLKYLDFSGKKNTNKSSLEVKVKEGFNMRPAEGENVATLTAVEEHRTLSCRIVSNPQKLALNDEFIESVEGLTEFDTHNRDSVSEWKNWFSRWGSHLVVKSYGGGRLHGSIVGPNVTNVLESHSDIDKVLNAIVKFTPFPVENLGYPSYRLYGGESDAESTNLYRLEEKVRENLISKWEESLNSNFIMLNNEFRLQPMSKIIERLIGPEKGNMTAKAITKLIRGELVYTRKRRVPPVDRPKSSGKGKEGIMKNETISQQNGNDQNHGAGISTVKEPEQNIPQVPSSSYKDQNHTHSSLNPSAPYNPPTGGYSQQPVNVDPNFLNPDVLQSQMDSNKNQIRQMEELLQARKHKSEMQYQSDLAKLEALKEDGKRLAKQKEEQLQRQQQLNEERNTMYQNSLLNAQEQNELELATMKRQREEIEKQMEEDEKSHLLTLELLKKQQKEQEEEAERRRCSGIGGFFACKIGR